MNYCYTIEREDNFFFNSNQLLKPFYTSKAKAIEVIENMLITGLKKDFGVKLTKDDLKEEVKDGKVIQNGNQTIKIMIGSNLDTVVINEETEDWVYVKSKFYYVRINEYYIRYACIQNVII